MSDDAQDKTVGQTDLRMQQSAEGSRYVFIPAVAVSDIKVTQSMLQVLCVLGSYGTRGAGWIYPSQSTIARYLGISRQAVNKSIKKLHELGYLQLRPQFDARGGRRVNEYRLDMNYDLPVERDRFARGLRMNDTFSGKSPATVSDTPATSEVAPPATSEVAPPATSEVAQNIRRRTDYREQTCSVASSNSISLQHSLAQSAKTAPTTPTTAQAPADRGTRESVFNTSALKRDPLFLALVACLGREPLTTREWKQWLQAVRELRTAQVTAAQIPQAIRGFQAQFPRATVTPLGLCNHWSLIWKGKAHDVAQLEIHQRTAAAAAAHPADDAARRERERAEVDQLMSEWGYGARAGDIPRG